MGSGVSDAQFAARVQKFHSRSITPPLKKIITQYTGRIMERVNDV